MFLKGLQRPLKSFLSALTYSLTQDGSVGDEICALLAGKHAKEWAKAKKLFGELEAVMPHGGPEDAGICAAVEVVQQWWVACSVAAQRIEAVSAKQQQRATAAEAAMAALLAEEQAERAKAGEAKSSKAAKKRKAKVAAKKAAEEAEAAAAQRKLEQEAAAAAAERQRRQREREVQQREEEQAVALQRLNEEAAREEAERAKTARVEAEQIEAERAAMSTPQQQQRQTAATAATHIIPLHSSSQQQPNLAGVLRPAYRPLVHAAKSSSVAGATAGPQQQSGDQIPLPQLLPRSPSPLPLQKSATSAREETSEVQELLSQLLPGLVDAGPAVAAAAPRLPSPAAAAVPLAQASSNFHLETTMICPLTRQQFDDPVIAGDGYSYERAALERWLAEQGTSPVTGDPLTAALVRPNHAVRALLEKLRDAGEVAG